MKFKADSLWLLLILSIGISACSKSETVEPLSQINVINAVPDLTSSDVYIDHQNITPGSLAFTKLTTYLNIYPGNRKFEITSAGLTKVLATKDTTLESGQAYTLFIANPDNSGLIMVRDDLTSPSAGKAKIRFANFGSDSPAFDLIINDAALIKNTAYKTVSEFVEIDTGKIALQLIESATSTIKLQTDTVEIAEGGIYSIWTKGLIDGSVAETEFGLLIDRIK